MWLVLVAWCHVLAIFDEWYFEVLRDVAALLTSEIVINVVLYACIDVIVMVECEDDVVRVFVVDGSLVVLVLRHYFDIVMTGCGLWFI